MPVQLGWAVHCSQVGLAALISRGMLQTVTSWHQRGHAREVVWQPPVPRAPGGREKELRQTRKLKASEELTWDIIREGNHGLCPSGNHSRVTMDDR